MNRKSSIKVSARNSEGKINVVQQFGFEESFDNRWESVKQLNELNQATPRRYEQSPIFARKRLTSSSTSSSPKLRGAREQTRAADERIPLLRQVPWSTDHPAASSSGGSHDDAAASSSDRPDVAGKLTAATGDDASFPPPPSPVTLKRAMSMK